MIKFIFVVFVLLCFLIRYLYTIRKNRKKFEIPSYIKETYKKLTILTNQLNINSRGYYEDEPDKVNSDGYSSIDVINSIENKSYNKIYKEISVLSYSFHLRGKEIILTSTPIEMPKIVLIAKLELHKQVDVYYDPDNNQFAYFDLAFLF